MRWARGDTGWYKHYNTYVYRIVEELTSFVSERLELHYPGVFRHLEKVIEVEGLGTTKVAMGTSPFTSFALTRDYNCRPHTVLGFILWLKEDYEEEEEEVSLFGFSELKCAFVPKHGDVLCFCPRDLLHCTRALMKKGLLGIAFFQKASLFRQLKRLLDLPEDRFFETEIPKSGKIPVDTIVERKKDFEAKKITYL